MHYLQFQVATGCTRDERSSSDQYKNFVENENRKNIKHVKETQRKKQTYRRKSSREPNHGAGSYGIFSTFFDQSFNDPLSSHSRNKRSASTFSTVTKMDSNWNDNSDYGPEQHHPLFEESQILVQITCDGGISWSTLKVLNPRQFIKPT